MVRGEEIRGEQEGREGLHNWFYSEKQEAMEGLEQRSDMISLTCYKAKVS